ncbi:PASTA domain-containing protein [Actinoplanes sp. NPDC051861]|uniref:PASTA domain-containing protein n=1 Tax=Actinoplanes sp. NPDC051861 TaxID=3155170 RepID=UPI00341D6016
MPEERPPGRDEDAPRPDETRPMDAAPNPSSGGPRSDDGDRSVWSGRAEVRPPRRGETEPFETGEADWADFGPAEEQKRWWTPIAVGIAALLLLGLLGFGIAVIVQNSGNGTETPSAPVTEATTPTRDSRTSAPTTPPTTTASTPPTTEPVDREVTVPALRGMPLEDAQAALERTGLTYRVIRRPSDAEPETVIDSDPPEGRLVPSDTRVTLVVAQPGTTDPAPSSPSATPR